MKKILKLLIVLFALMPFMSVNATSVLVKNPIKLYLFYGESCSHCNSLHIYLDKLEEDSSINYMFDVVDYEVWYNESNYNLMQDVASHLSIDVTGVPFTVIGNKYVIGNAQEEIKNKIISEYTNSNYTDIVAPLIKNTSYNNDEEDVIEVVLSPEESFENFISFFNGDNEDIYSYIDANNYFIIENIQKYIGKTTIRFENIKYTKVDDDTYKVKARVSAEGTNWNVNGFSVEFTLEEYNNKYIITETNLFDKIGPENVTKFVFSIFGIVIGILAVIGLVIIITVVIVIIVLKRRKKGNYNGLQ